MGPSYYLVTLDPVSRDEVRALILEQGGELDPGPYYDGAFPDPDGRLSVSWATDEKLYSILNADNFVDTKRGFRERAREYETLIRIAEALGGPPRDFVFLDLLNGPVSQQLAVRFATAFAKRWSPCVLETFFLPEDAEEGKNVWTMDDAFALASVHGRLPTVRHDIANWTEYYRQKQLAAKAEGLDD
jgi:hypothetical protein